jgi:large subunit ribosomal protein L10
MDRNQKSAVVEDLKTLLAEAKAMVFLSQKGLTVDQSTQFRRALRKEGSSFRVIKNTMMARAIEGSPFGFLSGLLKGPLAVAYTKGDPVALAKALTAFLKGNQQVTMAGGSLGTRSITATDLKALASLPPPEVLKSMLLGTLVGVPKKFLGVLQAPARDFLGVLKARERQVGDSLQTVPT